MKNVLSTALSAFFVLVAAFIVHRALTFDALTPSTGMAWSAMAQAVAVGILSDIWVAFIGSFCVLIAGIVRLERLIATSLIVSLAFASAAHQAYVEYFRFQIVPFHLTYLLDPDFVKANGRSILNGAVWLNLILIVSLLPAFYKISDIFLNKLAYHKLAYLALALIATLSHNRNIILRMRWFVPESLQLNTFERLYATTLATRLPAPLSLEQVNYLKQSIFPHSENLPVESIIKRKATDARNVDDVGKDIRNIFVEARTQGRKPLVISLLLESLRPSETGYFAPGEPSLTPYLDNIATKSITFMNAYSTGSVTRGAQEAILCGYFGSRDTSLMRGNAIVSAECLPDLLKTRKNVHTFWYHGGEGRFDSQADFWHMHHVKEIISQRDFSESFARTDWGIGDLSFLLDAAERIETLRSNIAFDAGLGMLLTVTNHIPWQLPTDAPQSLQKMRATEDHPSRLTVSYTDFALGNFVDSLKKKGIWDDLILVLVSDHGNSVAPHREIYKFDPARDYRLQSHINLVVSGGLVEQVLKRKNLEAMTRMELVSQADIAGFFGFLFDVDEAQFFGESLFLLARRSPVLSDIEQGLFNPRTGRFFSKKELIEVDPALQPEADRLGILYFRSFLRLIMQQTIDGT